MQKTVEMSVTDNKACEQQIVHIVSLFPSTEEVCLDPVIIFPICPVEDEEILASSSRPDTSPAQVRLDSGSAWVRAEDDTDGYVQIDLRYPDWASGVITMGYEGRDEYVTEYRVFYSMDGNNWDQVNNGGFFSRPMVRNAIRSNLMNIIPHLLMLMINATS